MLLFNNHLTVTYYFFSSNVLFIQPLAESIKTETRHKTVSTTDGLLEILKVKYRIPEPGTTISSFADS
jgi:hypothetical protein